MSMYLKSEFFWAFFSPRLCLLGESHIPDPDDPPDDGADASEDAVAFFEMPLAMEV